MPTYELAKDDVTYLINERVREMYPELDKYEVEIGALMAFPSGGAGPAVKLHGYPCAAIIRVVSLRDRVAGGPDVQIIFDGTRKEGWPSWSHEERIAVIDHELHHVELTFDKQGALVSDDHNRPKTRLKLHDWEIGGFRAIAERHGEHAFEVKMARNFADRFGQMLFGWAAPVGGEPVQTEAKKKRGKQAVDEMFGKRPVEA